MGNYPESLHSGRVDQIPQTVSAFQCGGYNWKQDSECQMFPASSPTVVDPSGTTSEASCFMAKDNPNPCQFGPNTYQWVRSKEGDYYYIPNEDGLMEYVEVGANGPASCGTSNNVFSSSNWPGQQGGSYMPDPQLTCDDDDCHVCVEHMLARSMVIGTLHADSNGGENCKILTASVGSTSCDGEETRLSCPSGELVKIVEAHYGRQPGSKDCLIPTHPADADKVVPVDNQFNCWEDITAILETDCGSNSECVVTPSAGYTPDENCKTIYSYIEVEYTCTMTTDTHGTSAEMN